jgi:hypothetical protein
MAEFPQTPQQAVAYAWLQAQDLSGKTPEETYNLYLDAVGRIVKQSKATR